MVDQHESEAPGAVAVHAYAWPRSAVAGDRVDLHLSSAASSVEVRIRRHGADATVVWSEVVAVDDHPFPADAAAVGCGWPAATSLTVDPAWPSGFYDVEADILLALGTSGTSSPTSSPSGPARHLHRGRHGGHRRLHRVAHGARRR
jgi:hypothetical protein